MDLRFGFAFINLLAILIVSRLLIESLSVDRENFERRKKYMSDDE